MSSKTTSGLSRSQRVLVWLMALVAQLFLGTSSTSIENVGKEEAIENDALPLTSLKVIAAGQGTTGTHSIYKELCQMQFKTIHYGQGCSLMNPHTANEYIEYAKNMWIRIANITLQLEHIDSKIDDFLNVLKVGKVEGVADTPV
jgi:hypothetical protein